MVILPWQPWHLNKPIQFTLHSDGKYLLLILYDHQHVIVGNPRPPVTVDETEKDEGEEAAEQHQAGVRLSELELLVSKDHAVMPSVEVFYTMLWCTCLLLGGVEVATSSTSDKETATSITRGVGVVSRCKWVHLCSQSGSIPGQGVLWSE